MPTLTLEITGKCPQMCGHCYGSFGPSLGHAQWDVFKALDDAKALGFEFVQFIGGEILTNQRLVDYVKHALSLGYTVELYSALMLPLQSGWRKELLSLDVMWATSFYTTNREAHDEFVKLNGSFDNLLSNIDLLRSLGRILRISHIDVGIANSSPSEVSKFLGIGELHSDSVRDFGRGSEITSGATLCSACGRGQKLAVLYNGEITSCPMSRSFIYGNINEGLENVWKSQRALTQRAKIFEVVGEHLYQPINFPIDSGMLVPHESDRPNKILVVAGAGAKSICDPQNGCKPENDFRLASDGSANCGPD